MVEEDTSGFQVHVCVYTHAHTTAPHVPLVNIHIPHVRIHTLKPTEAKGC